MISPRRHENQGLAFDARRAKRRRRAQWLSVGVACLIAAAAGTAYYGLFVSDWFPVRSFSVSGNRFIPAAAFRAAAEEAIARQNWFVRQLPHQSVWFWYFGASALEHDGVLPALRGADLKTNVVTGEVRASVRERMLAGVWCADECVAFDSEGIAFFPAPDLSGTLILKVKDENPHALPLGQPVHASVAEIKTLLETARIIKEEGIPVEEAVVKDEALGEWEAKTGRGSVFRFSLEFTPPHLAETLRGVASRARLEDLEYLDFRVPNRLYYR